MSEQRSVALVLAAGMFTLGTLVGTLVAMSAQSLAQSVIAALFALFGGSLLALIDKRPLRDQIKLSAGILAISVGTLFGIYSGLYVNEHKLLTPKLAGLQKKEEEGNDGPAEEARKYLRENVMPKAREIDQKLRTGLISRDKAYEELLSIIADKDK